ncbi:MAG: glutathione S-transferase [SAR86 cluster bacterium]|uniref:Glutathione S-transferase n=1 Tax=SAR86 cluster bacterium TaxID=2030880 RepID=A0A2A5C8U7_9GAMM|nr:glutathione S-transferase family protein [Gammaproteobacteria bacterium AH-315-E17]PCJ39796.1 MAG: glutathione S-transferase [SAR86 cluster bacterium]
MAELTLFYSPGACARVTLNALEELGLEFEAEVVNLGKGGQRTPDYLAINPKGKVPALKIGGQVLTENAAILYFLHTQHPESGLLPLRDDPVEYAQGLSDLVWCGGTLHPLIRQIMRPDHYTVGDTSGVNESGHIGFTKVIGQLEQHFSSNHWWYGDTWSIVDVYLYWVYSTAQAGGFSLDDYPAVNAHTKRVRARPSFQRALARELAAVESEGIQLPPGAKL